MVVVVVVGSVLFMVFSWRCSVFKAWLKLVGAGCSDVLFVVFVFVDV